MQAVTKLKISGGSNVCEVGLSHCFQNTSRISAKTVLSLVITSELWTIDGSDHDFLFSKEDTVYWPILRITVNIVVMLKLPSLNGPLYSLFFNKQISCSDRKLLLTNSCIGRHPESCSSVFRCESSFGGINAHILKAMLSHRANDDSVKV